MSDRENLSVLHLTDGHGNTILNRQSDGTWRGDYISCHSALDALSMLAPGWNGYNAPPPGRTAIADARLFLDIMLANGDQPTRIGPSAVGGVAVTMRAGEAQAYVEFRNHGSRLVMLTEDGKPDKEPIILRMHPYSRIAIDGTLAFVRGFLGGAETSPVKGNIMKPHLAPDFAGEPQVEEPRHPIARVLESFWFLAATVGLLIFFGYMAYGRPGPRLVASGPMPGGGTWARYSVPVVRDGKEFVGPPYIPPGTVIVPDTTFTANKARVLSSRAEEKDHDAIRMMRFAESVIEHAAREGKTELLFAMIFDRPPDYIARFRKALEARGFVVLDADPRRYSKGVLLIRW